MKTCIVCKSKLKQLLEIKNMPSSAQNLPQKEDLDKDRGIDINLCECISCRLVQLDTPAVSYYRDVIRAGGISSTMEELRKKQYKEFIALANLNGKKIIEVGCGQGEFLSILSRYPVEAYGLENNASLVEKALEKGLNVSKGYTEDIDYIFANGPFDAFTSFNFLEHQPDPQKYLKVIANNLTEEGYGLITVPSFEYILEENSFYEIIPDHIAYYTEDSLETLLRISGFDILKKERVNRDTISMIIRKKKNTDIKGILLKKDSISCEVKALLDTAIKEKKRIAVWGASHQGFTLCATTDIAYGVDYIIDSAPFKQNKYAPASHIPIVSKEYAKENPVDIIIIIAPGYTDEIFSIIREELKTEIEVYTLKTDHLIKLT